MSVAVGALAASESKRLFRSPLAWIVLALGEGFMALFFMLLVVRYLENEAALRASGVTNAVLVPYFTAANLGMLLVAPLLTMNAIAGERRDGTLRFLYSTPLGALDIVGGKLGGVLGLTGAYVLLVVLMPATLFWGTPLDAGVYAANVLGLALFTLMHVSLGLMCSALTRQPVAAALVALVVSLALWLLDWAVRLDPAASHIGAHATLARLRGFSLGLVSSADIAWFVLASLLFLALTALLVDADRSLA